MIYPPVPFYALYPVLSGVILSINTKCLIMPHTTLNFVVAGACQSFYFSDKQPGFSEIIKLCLNLGIEFCITLLVLPNYKKITSKKVNLNLTTCATLICLCLSVRGKSNLDCGN